MALVNQATNNSPKAQSAEEQKANERKTVDQWVARAQGGDREAFKLLFEKYHRRAFSVALGVVKNREDALDIVQNAFVKVHRHIGTFQGSSGFYTWLYRIVMNLCIDHTRKKKRVRQVGYDDGVSAHEERDMPSQAPMASLNEGRPEKVALRRELSTHIEAALAELPEHHRAVILLREVEGFSYEEIAQTLDVPKGTVMSRLFHARRKMQAELEPYLQGTSNKSDEHTSQPMTKGDLNHG